MNNKYNLFILLSSLGRNIIEIFNIVLLYKLKYTFKEILLFYIVFYIVSLIISIITIKISNNIKNKYLLIISNILLIISYYYFINIRYNLINLLLYSILLATSSSIYYVIRHYYAIKYININNKEITNISIYNYLALVISSFAGGFINKKYIIIIVTLLLFLSMIPILLINDSIDKEDIINIKINNKRILFFILEQSKIIFLLLQPLYLYIYINSNIKYISIFNILSIISFILVIKYLTNRININKYFKYLNIILIFILIIKLSIYNKFIVLGLSLLEGIFIKIYEIISINNLYNINISHSKSYLLKVEIIFYLVRILFMILLYIFINNIKIGLIILLPFILISGFIYSNK